MAKTKDGGPDTPPQEITEELSDTVLAEVNEAMQVIAERHGLHVRRFAVRWSKIALPVGVAFHPPAQSDMDVAGSMAILEAQYARDFIVHAPRYGLTPDDLGRKYRDKGQTYRVVGCIPANRKYPIIVRGADGRSLRKVPAEHVRVLLEAIDAVKELEDVEREATD
jgi:hypothetical protein